MNKCYFSRDMITWDKNITEPPPTKSISIEDLKLIGNGEKKLSDFIPKVMCHSIGKILANKRFRDAIKIGLTHTARPL